MRPTGHYPPMVLPGTIISASFVDYLIVGLYFAVVLGIGVLARRQVSDSIDFFLSGRSLPAWVTGLAFISANLGAVEIMGMSASGAEFGLPTLHYFWIGAIPAMLFLGVVMMPFYYGSKVRSVPEFMRRRFGTGAHLVNAISFAVAQLLIAGINLFLLGTIIRALLGWPLWVSLVIAAAVVLSYITLGGLSAAIYNEVLQFFVIVASLLPLTLIGLNRVGGWDGLTDKITSAAADNPDIAPPPTSSSTPGPATRCPASTPTSSRSSASSSASASCCPSATGPRTSSRSRGRWPRTRSRRPGRRRSSARSRRCSSRSSRSCPGMIAAVLVTEIAQTKAGETVKGGASGDVTYNDSLLYLMRDLLPNGLLGLAIAGLLAAFMAGMAANVSAFNTVFSYDLWQTYVVKERDDDYYLRVGRLATVRRHGDRHLHGGRSRRTSRTSWTTSRCCSGSSTRHCSRPSSWACSGSG